jgi:hypothetical protein
MYDRRTPPITTMRRMTGRSQTIQKWLAASTGSSTGHRLGTAGWPGSVPASGPVAGEADSGGAERILHRAAAARGVAGAARRAAERGDGARRRSPLGSRLGWASVSRGTIGSACGRPERSFPLRVRFGSSSLRNPSPFQPLVVGVGRPARAGFSAEPTRRAPVAEGQWACLGVHRRVSGCRCLVVPACCVVPCGSAVPTVATSLGLSCSAYLPAPGQRP